MTYGLQSAISRITNEASSDRESIGHDYREQVDRIRSSYAFDRLSIGRARGGEWGEGIGTGTGQGGCDEKRSGRKKTKRDPRSHPGLALTSDLRFGAAATRGRAG